MIQVSVAVDVDSPGRAPTPRRWGTWALGPSSCSSIGRAGLADGSMAGLVVLWGPQSLPVLWPHVPNTAIGSYTSKVPQNDIGNSFGLYICVGLGQTGFGSSPSLALQWCTFLASGLQSHSHCTSVPEVVGRQPTSPVTGFRV